MRIPVPLGFVLLATLLGGPALADPPYVWAYGYSAAGLSACGTFSPTQQIYAAFSSGVISVSQPQGVACGVGEDLHELQSPLGPVAAGSIESVSWGGGSDPQVYLGDSMGSADFGVLGAQANGTYSGPVSSATVIGSEAFGVFHEHFTVNGAPADAGTTGTFRATFSIDGATSLAGRGYAYFAIFYTVNGGAQYMFYRAQTDSYSSGGSSVYLNGGYVTSPDQAPDLTILPDSIQGSVEAVFETSLVFGQPLELTVSEIATALPSSSVDLLGPSSAHSDFLGAATLTKIAILKNGSPVPSFTITSGSGTYYDADGVHPAPEPAPAAATITALATLARLRRRHPR